MVNKENYYLEYKGHTKWLSLICSHFAKKMFFGMTLLRAHAHYICIVCAKYQTVSVKALVQADFLMCALSKLFNRKNMAKFTKLSFCQKMNIWASNFFTQMFNVPILRKQKLWYKLISLHMHYLFINALRITKGNNSNRIGP